MKSEDLTPTGGLKTIPILLASFPDKDQILAYRMDIGQNMWDFCTLVGLNRKPSDPLPEVEIQWWEQAQWDDLNKKPKDLKTQ